MQTFDEIREALRKMAPRERKRLLQEELDAVAEAGDLEPEQLPENPYARTLSMAGSMHSHFTDLSSDKNRHIAEAIWEHKHG